MDLLINILSKLLDVEEKEIRNQRLAMGMHQVWEPVHVSMVQKIVLIITLHIMEKIKMKYQDNKKIMILGGGPNRIGQGIEFDYCCVHASLALKKLGFETIIVNCNPETVSTDYDTSDKLYFEPLTLEDVLSIHEKEKPVRSHCSIWWTNTIKSCKSIKRKWCKYLRNNT